MNLFGTKSGIASLNIALSELGFSGGSAKYGADEAKADKFDERFMQAQPPIMIFAAGWMMFGNI